MNGACIMPLESGLEPQTGLIKSHVISLRRGGGAVQEGWRLTGIGGSLMGYIIDIDVKQTA